ncbi:AraC family transcriptional regulator ligand-binding domain-containing protein [Paucibacter sp. PLA-PC-4]|uniref:AraC family transcriptional regulator n=1 Tax=Paucibacter sp. PLA-PC-4 TaxID=2993655 RepID=UPI00224B7D83|nr:AraC family transcriptional regulator [Paucibacter sp. PLA-PC-4]MCX2864094.1 AraC family transcriptional regulator ligand-binding domain-containing protein [Paucibacter sp. PLA-PC-4]
MSLAQQIAELRPLGLAAEAGPLSSAPYQLDSACIAWSDHGALLAELARSRGLDLLAWLAAAGVRQGQVLLSPRQLLALLAPLQACGADSAFVIGRLSLPGHYGLASQALYQSGCLLDALRLLVRHAGRLSPLLTPRLLCSGPELLLYWTEACGAPPAQRAFLVDQQMSAVSSMCEQLAGQRLPWRYSFNRTRPRDPAQHVVYLGGALRFGCQVDAMRIDLALAQRPWPAVNGVSLAGSALAAGALAQGADPASARRGLLAALYDHLLGELTRSPSLDTAAAAFGISPATLKRHLAQHGTHFQAELDQVRSHVALYLLGLQSQPSEVVAQQLGFYDAANFRRAFRRWTGINPGALAPS